MKKEYILIIDSGIGGLSTLSEIIKIVPSNYIYYADNKHCPYGSHTKEEITNFLITIIKEIQKSFFFKIVVLACNTATTSAIEQLRNYFKNLIFVGTEPAIKLAGMLGHKKVLCLCTPTTSHQKKFKILKSSLEKSQIMVVPYALDDFAKNIEDYLTKNTLNSYISVLKDLFCIQKMSKDFDCIVLGCTHYCFVANKISSFSQKTVIDGNAGVAKQVFRVYKNFHKKSFRFQNSHKRVIFLSSDKKSYSREIYIKIFKQILANYKNVC